MKKNAARIAGGMAVLALVAGLYGCPPGPLTALDEIGRLPGNSGFRNELIGEERLVSLEQGNLSEGTASGAQERIDTLAGFLQEYAVAFGAPAGKAVQPMFLAAAPEQQSIVNENEMHQTVFLHQEHKGAIVMDALLWGEFVGLAETGGQLRRVQGRLFDPAVLVDPVASNSDTLGLAMGQMRAFLSENGLSQDNARLLPVPVIFGEKNITGFLGHYAVSHEDGSTDRMSVVVNPLLEDIQIISIMPACRAHNALGEAS